MRISQAQRFLLLAIAIVLIIAFLIHPTPIPSSVTMHNKIGSLDSSITGFITCSSKTNPLQEPQYRVPPYILVINGFHECSYSEKLLPSDFFLNHSNQLLIIQIHGGQIHPDIRSIVNKQFFLSQLSSATLGSLLPFPGSISSGQLSNNWPRVDWSSRFRFCWRR